MRIQGTIVRAFVAAALALSAAACAGDGERREDGGLTTSDEEGDLVPPDKVVRIVGIDRSKMQTEGRVRYRVENVSPDEQPDLVWSVSFLFPRPQGGEITLNEITEPTAEIPLRLAAGRTSDFLEATCLHFQKYKDAGIPVRGTRLNVQLEEPVQARARSSVEPGTLFLSGKIECVGMSDDLYGQKILWIEFENVTQTRLPSFDVQAVFARSGARTLKKAGPGLTPGQRARVELDIEGLDLGNREFAVKVTPGGL